MELMSNFSLNISRVEKEFGINFKEYFDDALKALEEFEQAELITVGDEKIEVSQTGTMLIRNICMPFDAYLVSPEKPVFCVGSQPNNFSQAESNRF
jgi:oxygen-independent coproporphyrinogen-3 oxidase